MARISFPSIVHNLRIDAHANLTWEKNPNEICVIWEYQVDIVGDRDEEYHFTVKVPHLDVSFLNVCEEWQFTVTPISNGYLGFERRLTDHIPLPTSNHTLQIPAQPEVASISGLRPNSMYFLRVSVENLAGLSPATPIAVQTSELQ
ncbi:hypothetical protein NQ315_001417 [Exocentrus adspersus]|uniref:Fibronectin type-III domain-containing protein n=1 Tax=Exocentrus adspersus TaxID=1586481 RepID=A0AAV8WFM2_9CUCU|nr:hypothetical protein NQ315_001417 [Exocentrus adspersus]